jgi:hypothetical protein
MAEDPSSENPDRSAGRIRKLVPCADVYEMDTQSRYFVVLKGNQIPDGAVAVTQQMMESLGLPCIVVVCPSNIKFEFYGLIPPDKREDSRIITPFSNPRSRGKAH